MPLNASLIPSRVVFPSFKDSDVSPPVNKSIKKPRTSENTSMLVVTESIANPAKNFPTSPTIPRTAVNPLMIGSKAVSKLLAVFSRSSKGFLLSSSFAKGSPIFSNAANIASNTG